MILSPIFMNFNSFWTGVQSPEEGRDRAAALRPVAGCNLGEGSQGEGASGQSRVRKAEPPRARLEPSVVQDVDVKRPRPPARARPAAREGLDAFQLDEESHGREAGPQPSRHVEEGPAAGSHGSGLEKAGAREEARARKTAEDGEGPAEPALALALVCAKEQQAVHGGPLHVKRAAPRPGRGGGARTGPGPSGPGPRRCRATPRRPRARRGPRGSHNRQGSWRSRGYRARRAA